MDKNFTIKKKQLFEKDSNNNITVKIECSANHLLDSHIVDLIEQQLFKININLREYKEKKDTKKDK